MKKLFKLSLGIILTLLAMRACREDYICDVYWNIPVEIREMLADNGIKDMEEVVTLWEVSADSIIGEAELKYEYLKVESNEKIFFNRK